MIEVDEIEKEYSKHIIESPLIESVELRSYLGSKVLLKMESSQESGSFKMRGMSYICSKYASKGCKGFISSSGGNAGYAVALSGMKLGLPVTIGTQI